MTKTKVDEREAAFQKHMGPHSLPQTWIEVCRKSFYAGWDARPIEERRRG